MTLSDLGLNFFTGAAAVLAGVGAILGALSVVLARRTFRAVMGLLVLIVCLSIEYVILAAPIIAFIQILVYAGAVVVLFLFVVMLLDLGKSGSEAPGKGPVRWEIAVLGAALLFITAVCGIYLAFSTGNPPPTDVDRAPPGGAAEAVGNALFLHYLVSFEAAAVFLLAAVIVAIYIAPPRGSEEKSEANEADPVVNTPEEPDAPEEDSAAPVRKEAS